MLKTNQQRSVKASVKSSKVPEATKSEHQTNSVTPRYLMYKRQETKPQ